MHAIRGLLLALLVPFLVFQGYVPGAHAGAVDLAERPVGRNAPAPDEEPPSDPASDPAVACDLVLAPTRLIIPGSTQLAVTRGPGGPIVPGASLVWTSLTPTKLILSNQGFATPIGTGSWSVRVEYRALGMVCVLHGETVQVVQCPAESNHSAVPAPPAPPAPTPVRRVIICNQYPGEDDFNASIINGGEALKQTRYNGDDVLILRLGVGGRASLAAVRDAIVQAGITPGSLASIDFLGHGSQIRSEGEVGDHDLKFGSGEIMISTEMTVNARAIKFGASAPNYKIPSEVAALFGGFLRTDAKVHLHHCFSGDATANGNLPEVGRALRNAIDREVVGYKGMVWFHHSSTPGQLFLPEGELETFPRGGNVVVNRSETAGRRAAAPWGRQASVVERAVVVTVYDVAGRRIRRIRQVAHTTGTRAFEWDGRDDGGRSVRPGVYFVRTRHATGASQTRVTILR